MSDQIETVTNQLVNINRKLNLAKEFYCSAKNGRVYSLFLGRNYHSPMPEGWLKELEMFVLFKSREYLQQCEKERLEAFRNLQEATIEKEVQS